MSDDDPTSFELDRSTEDQPPRDDLIDPEDLRDEERPDEEDDDEAVEPLPTSEEQPETQGSDFVAAPRETEDAGQRHPLSDDERR